MGRLINTVNSFLELAGLELRSGNTSTALHNTLQYGFWKNIFSGDFFSQDSASGEEVTPDKALGIPAILSVVRLISDTMGTATLDVYKVTSEGKKLIEDINNPYYYITHRKAGAFMNPINFFQALYFRAALYGSVAVRIHRFPTGVPRSFEFIDPSSMVIKPLLDGTEEVEYTSLMGQPDGKGGFMRSKCTGRDIIYLPYMTSDGIQELSPFALTSDSVGEQLAISRRVGGLYKNGLNSNGAFSFDRTLNDAAIDGIHKQYKNYRNGKPLLLEKGTKYTPTTMTLADGRVIELRDFGVDDAARLYNIPNALVKDPQRNVDYEGLFARFVDISLKPFAKKLEVEFNEKVPSLKSIGKIEWRYDFQLLRYPSRLKRLEYSEKLMQNGLSTRAKEAERLRLDKITDPYANEYLVKPDTVLPISKAVQVTESKYDRAGKTQKEGEQKDKVYKSTNSIDNNDNADGGSKNPQPTH